MTNAQSSAVKPAANVLALAAVMRSAGWEVQFIDLDLTGAAAKADMRIKRDDGLCVHARVDQLGRASVERFRRVCSLEMDASTKGRRPLSPMVADHFIGRDRYQGARAMLRGLTAYLADNALRPVALRDMRGAWASVMSAPLQLGA